MLSVPPQQTLLKAGCARIANYLGTMGDELFQAGRYDEALEAYCREGNLRGQGCALEALGEFARAEEFYRQASEKASWDARTHQAMAGFLARRERWDEARQAALAGLRCPYATPPVRYELAVVLATGHMKQGALAEAFRIVGELERSGAETLDVAWLRSKLLLLEGRRREAHGLLQLVYEQVSQLLARQPELAVRWTLLGDCCYARGDLEEAHRAYDRALQCPVRDWAACRGLGILAEKRGQAEQARSFYARFLQGDPLNLSCPSIRQRLAALEKQTQAH